jgi:hypothetical protein
VLATEEEAALRAVGAAQADAQRDARERSLSPRAPVRKDRGAGILRRVARAERLRPADVQHRVAVAPVEIAALRSGGKRVQAAADVAPDVRSVGVRERGDVDAADVLGRRLEEVRRTRRGRTRSAGREEENGPQQQCLHAGHATPGVGSPQGVISPSRLGDFSRHPDLGSSRQTRSKLLEPDRRGVDVCRR